MKGSGRREKANQQSDVQRTAAQAADAAESAYTQARDLARQQALDNLAARQLLSVKAGVVDLSLMQAKLRVETDSEAIASG